MKKADTLRALALLSLIVAAVGLLKLGWIADFLPAPVITGLPGLLPDISAGSVTPSAPFCG